MVVAFRPRLFCAAERRRENDTSVVANLGENLWGRIEEGRTASTKPVTSNPGLRAAIISHILTIKS